MTLVHNSVTVPATTATLIATIPVGNPLTCVHVSNSDTAIIFVGDSSLSNTGADKGARVAISGSLDIWLNSGDSLYAYSVAGTSANAVAVLYSKVID
jgi:uncharacterized Zn-binding protein involved in type VI secretion